MGCLRVSGAVGRVVAQGGGRMLHTAAFDFTYRRRLPEDSEGTQRESAVRLLVA